jgi:hypothetical protein
VQRQLASVQITLAYFSQEQIAYIMAFVVDQHAASQYFKTWIVAGQEDKRGEDMMWVVVAID